MNQPELEECIARDVQFRYAEVPAQSWQTRRQQEKLAANESRATIQVPSRLVIGNACMHGSSANDISIQYCTVVIIITITNSFNSLRADRC
jgi:hypothetical protein